MGASVSARARRGGDPCGMQQRLKFKEAALGCKREVVAQRGLTLRVRLQRQRGEAGDQARAVSHCRGTGQVSNARGFVMFTSTCGRAQGQGAVIKHVCKTCGRGTGSSRSRAR